MCNKTILISKKDKRLINSYERFINAGFNCSFIDKNNLNSPCDYIILPIPSFIDDNYVNDSELILTDDFFRMISPGTVIFGGLLSDLIMRKAKEYNLKLVDYTKSECFCLYNAIPTAEAAIIIGFTKIEKTVFNSNISIIGYGRIGKVLADRLQKLGGSVTVVARNTDALIKAQSNNLKTALLKDYLSKPIIADICFNTVPCRIIGKSATANSDCKLFVDLASKPGGFDENAEIILGDRLIRALSLPGKYYPVSAGDIIFKTINNIISEMRN